MKKSTFVAMALVIVSTQVLARQPEQFAKITDSNMLFKEAKIDIKAMHPCQPLRGDTVAVLEVKKNLEGMTGVDVAHVRVITGRCKDQEGWVGLVRLEAVSK